MRKPKTTKSKKTAEIANLKTSQQRVLHLLSQQSSCSSSDQNFAKQANVGTTYLRVLLEELVAKGYLNKKRHGQKVQYIIVGKYRRYFT